MKIAFLDRDGVINEDYGYVSQINNFVFRKGIFDFCYFLIQSGFKIAVVTNQSGISRKFFTINDYMILTEFMINQFYIKGIELIDIEYCPHLKTDKCKCRKPKPGMIKKILKKNNVLPNDCIFVGDKETDLISARASGIKNVFLMSSSLTTNDLPSSLIDFKLIKKLIKSKMKNE